MHRRVFLTTALAGCAGAAFAEPGPPRPSDLLGARGRRRQGAEEQILACRRIIASGEAARRQLRGSWAGAMGQTQFIPAAFIATAVDGDGDGKRDIWGSSADALASAANLLVKG